MRKLNLPGVVTTYITGTITSLTSGFARGEFANRMEGELCTKLIERKEIGRVA